MLSTVLSRHGATVVSLNSHFPLKIQLYGRFKLISVSGEEIRLTSTKLQALLALIASDPEMTRKRDWVSSTLWSRSVLSQSLTNLRQALLRLKADLGQCQDVLVINRTNLSLDSDKLIVETQSENALFLEDLVINDPNFQSWLAKMRGQSLPDDRPSTRAQITPGQTQRERMRLVISPQSVANSSARTFENAVVTALSQLIRERTAITVFNKSRVLETTNQPTLEVEIRATEVNCEQLSLSAQLTNLETGADVWFDDCTAVLPTGPLSHNVQCLGLSHRIADAVINQILKRDSGGLLQPTHEGAAINLAIREMFTMTSAGFDRAETMFKSLEQSGEAHAWQAQLAVIRYIEREAGSHCSQSLREIAEYHVSKAMEINPIHSDVLSAVSNSRLVFDSNPVASLELSDIAVRTNKANPLAWWARSNALLYAGKSEKAYLASVFAQKLTDSTSLKFWGDIQRALCAAATDRMSEAHYYVQSSHQFNGVFRPPLRYLLGFQSLVSDSAATEETARKLAELEPNFSIDRFLNDPDYPISMMRRKKLFHKERILGTQI